MTVFERRMWHWAWSARSRLDLKRGIPGESQPGRPAQLDRAGRGSRWAPSYSSALRSAPGTFTPKDLPTPGPSDDRDDVACPVPPRGEPPKSSKLY